MGLTSLELALTIPEFITLFVEGHAVYAVINWGALTYPACSPPVARVGSFRLGVRVNGEPLNNKEVK